jgi:GntR family transcriptional regulator, rspAB operon transcriptional repressor
MLSGAAGTSQPEKGTGGSGAAARLLPLGAYEGSLATRVYQSLKDAILSLEYQPGEILRKGEICDHLGISRSPVSEAVTRLAAEGLVDVVPQAGTFVARFSMSEIREGAFLREALEVAAVEKVAEAITEEQLVALRRSLRIQEALVEDGDVAGFYKLDAEMHEMILSFTGYRRLAQIAETSWLQVNRARRLVLPNRRRITETLEEHRAIVEALEARDHDAARIATRAHLRQLLRYLEPLEREHPELFQRR